MPKTKTLSVIAALIVCAAGSLHVAFANEPGIPAEPAAPAGPAAAEEKSKLDGPKSVSGVPLAETVKAEKGSLKNPFTDKPEAIEEGKKLYLSYSCNGCHGGGGGGGMCPPLTNETWIYGSDDDTLFRLITLGSRDLIALQGFARKRQEAVKGPMPPYTEIIDDSEKLWKIIAFIRSVYKGRAEKRDW